MTADGKAAYRARRSPITLLETNAGVAVASVLFAAAGAVVTVGFCAVRAWLTLAEAEDVDLDYLPSPWVELLLRGPGEAPTTQERSA